MYFLSCLLRLFLSIHLLFISLIDNLYAVQTIIQFPNVCVIWKPPTPPLYRKSFKGGGGGGGGGLLKAMEYTCTYRHV